MDIDTLIKVSETCKFSLHRVGTRAIKSPVWYISNSLGMIVSNGKYKWVSERWRREFSNK